jgi:streptogramin lyase
VADGCNGCIITDIAQGPGGILYITSNDPTLMRFNVATQSFETPVQMPNTSALGGNLAVSATDVWITDFNNDVVWRDQLSTGQFTSCPITDPADVAVDVTGNAWFTQPGDVNAPGTSNIGRIDAVTGAVTTTPTTDGSTVAPRSVTVASDGNPGQDSQEQRPVRDHRRPQRRPLVHHDGRQQDRHTAAAVGRGPDGGSCFPRTGYRRPSLWPRSNASIAGCGMII